MLKNARNIIKKKIYRNMEEYDINIKELKEMQKLGATLIDVRSAAEYKEGHLSGAINVPEYEIKSKFNKLNLEKDKIIILYCISGYRSKRAYIKLKKLGYNRIYNLYGGLEAY